VKSTFKRGVAIGSLPPRQTPWKPLPFACAKQDRNAIRISGCGRARVIGIVPHQIITDSLEFDLDAHNIPDLDRDILKVVVCNRYKEHPCGIGLVHGFSLVRGAIAASVAHDAHNIVAVGVSDHEIVLAINAVIRNRGAMVIVDGRQETVLPLECAGLMSLQPFEKVVSELESLKNTVSQLGAISDPFMYLSFLSLTVIANLRITDRGLFDVGQFKDVPLFVE